MKTVKGTLRSITRNPSRVREVFVRAPVTRADGEGDGLLVDLPERADVGEDGVLSFPCSFGLGVLVLSDGVAREHVPFLVHEGTGSLRQAVEDAKDFTPDSHDRLAELLGETSENLAEARRVRAEADKAVVRISEATRVLSLSVADAVGKATAGVKAGADAVLGRMQELQESAENSETSGGEAAKVALDSQKSVTASEQNVTTLWGQIRSKVDEWAPHARQLDKWQPQYEWLKENATSGFEKIAEMLKDATAGVRGELTGLVEQARTAQTTAGQHSLKAQAAANNAESVTNRVVDAAINKLLGGASSAYDTLKELEDKLTSQDSVAAAIMRQLAEKASQADVSALAQKITNLGIDGVRGLSAALASKANTSHTHATSEIVGLAGELNTLKSDVSQKADAHDMAAKVDRDDVAGIVEKSRKVEEAWDYARRALVGMPDMRVVDVVPDSPSPNVWYFVKEAQ